MAGQQQDLEEEVYPGYDTCSAKALIAIPSKDVQLLIARIRSLIPGGETLVEVTHTS